MLVAIIMGKRFSGDRMPLITSHMNTPCIHANQNAHEAGLMAMAGDDIGE